MLSIKGYGKYIIFGVTSVILLLLLKNIYAKNFGVEEFIQILFLDFAGFEKLGLQKFTIPYLAAFLILICFIFNYVSAQFVKINNTHYLVRFSLKPHYIIYIFKGMMKEVFMFLMIWFFIIVIYLYASFQGIAPYIFVICIINILKIWALTSIVCLLYVLIIFVRKKINLSIWLLMLLLIFCTDLVLGTLFLTMSSIMSESLIYLFMEVITLLALYCITVKYYKKHDVIGEYYD